MTGVVGWECRYGGLRVEEHIEVRTFGAKTKWVRTYTGCGRLAGATAPTAASGAQTRRCLVSLVSLDGRASVAKEHRPASAAEHREAPQAQLSV